MSLHNRKTIVVTGFGPFGVHVINASWEAVKRLPEMLDAEKLGINLVVEEIPVVYDQAIERLQALCEKYKPVLMVHVGVSHKATELTLEVCAHKVGYCRDDVQGKVPSNKACCIGHKLQEVTALDVQRISAEFNKTDPGVTCCTSEDAGLYLCEFTFYTSLCLTGNHSLFIHVPDIGKPYSPTETAHGICKIITLAVSQLKEMGSLEDKAGACAC